MSGFAAWIFCDGRSEVGDVEREEFNRNRFAAIVLDETLHPLCRDLAVIVVGCDDVDLLAPFVHRIGNNLGDGLGGRGAGIEVVVVAHAAFILRIVEIERVVAGQRRADRLAAGRCDAAMHRRGLFAGCRLGGELGIELDVRLCVVHLQLDFAAEQAARGVDILDCKLGRLGHGRAVDVEAAGKVENRCEDDLVRGMRAADECGHC